MAGSRSGAEVASVTPQARIVHQDQQLGTGHAVRMVTEAIGAIPGTVVVCYGDMPLLAARRCANSSIAVTGPATRSPCSPRAATPPGTPDRQGRRRRVPAHRRGTRRHARGAAIDEYNSGCYAFDGTLLADAVERVTTNNEQQQEYLTDVVDILRGDGHEVGTMLAADAGEITGVNDRVQLSQARRELNDRILDGWMRAGVTIIDPASTWIDVTVTIGQDAEIGPQTQLQGATVIGEAARVGPGCLLEDTVVGEDAVVSHAVCQLAEIGPRATVGPYAYLRPGTSLAEDAHVGAHVELKKASVGPGAKVPHLTYVGDATIGAGANIGPARSSPTTTGWPRTTPRSASTRSSAATPCWWRRSPSGTAPTRRRARRSPTRCQPGTSACPGPPARFRRMDRPQPTGSRSADAAQRVRSDESI